MKRKCAVLTGMIYNYLEFSPCDSIWSTSLGSAAKESWTAWMGAHQRFSNCKLDENVGKHPRRQTTCTLLLIKNMDMSMLSPGVEAECRESYVFMATEGSQRKSGKIIRRPSVKRKGKSKGNRTLDSST